MSDEHKQPQFIYFFGDGHADGGGEVKHLVGGKGASLADMTRFGLNVPPGFTLSTECCAHYFRTGHQWPEGLEAEVRANLARLEKLTGHPFGRGDDPLLVSVRSGAAESMPGMMDTILNVGLNPDCVRAMAGRTGQARAAWLAYRHFLATFGQVVGGVEAKVFDRLTAEILAESKKKTEDDLDAWHLERLCDRFQGAYQKRTGHPLPSDPWLMLRSAIDAVFRSWNNERAVAYRRYHHIQGLLGTAVTVQVMCPSEVAGVLFTANPVNPALDQVIIESSYGLGEAIVLGKVTPDRFVLDRNQLHVLERDIAVKDQVVSAAVAVEDEAGQDKQSASLSEAQLQDLARLGLQVEDFFQAPCDIEWGLSRGKFYLLQSRPIKGLEDARRIEQVRRETIARLQQLSGGRRCAWVIYNLAESLPSPTPLTWDLMGRFMSGSGGFGQMYQDLGFLPSARVKQEGFLDLVGGRIYLNTQRHAELFWSDFPWEYDIDLVKKDMSQAEAMPTKMDPARAGILLLLKLPAYWRKMRRSRKTIDRLKQDYDRHFQEQVLPPYLDFIKAKRDEDLSEFDDAALLHELDLRYQRVMDNFGKEAVKLSYFGGAAYAELAVRLQETFGEAEGQALAGLLAAGLDDDKTMEANQRLMDVAQGLVTQAEFLDAFGHRAHQEFELSQPRWRENTSFIDHMVENFRANPAADPYQLHERMKSRRQDAERTLPDKLRSRDAAKMETALADLCDLVRRYLPYRETAKHYLLMGYELLRQVVLEIDRRRGLEGGIFFLHQRELPELMKGRDFSKIITDRRERRRAELRIHVPDVITTDDLEAIGRPIEVENNGDALQGTGVAPGSGTGPAVVVHDPAEALALPPGYVLVCPSTDPGWTPLFIPAAGLIMERGGALSHGAVVARDLGIPAVVIRGATRSIAPDELIRVDGDRGLATRVKKEPASQGQS